jgi:hypothetical protein
MIIWFTTCRDANAGSWCWFPAAILHYPTISMSAWLFPNLLEKVLSLPGPIVYCVFGTILWYVFGWMIGRLVMFYRDHS